MSHLQVTIQREQKRLTLHKRICRVCKAGDPKVACILGTRVAKSIAYYQSKVKK